MLFEVSDAGGIAIIALALLQTTPSPASSLQVAQSPLHLSDCTVTKVDETLKCGIYFAVENRGRDNGRRLGLKVVLLPNKSGREDHQPIFIFAGGPGEAATDYARPYARSPLRKDHDIVLVDQRGTAGDHRLDCPLPTSEADAQTYLQTPYERINFWRQCAVALGKKADLTQYATPVAAMDVDDVRKALGYDKINVLGGSYGSRAAMIYAKMFGAHVHAALFTGIVPLEIKLPLHHAERAQVAFDLMVEDCRTNTRCRAAYPNIRGDLAVVLRRLTRNPATVAVKHPGTKLPVKIKLTRNAFAEALRDMLYSADAARKIPLVLKRARSGDFRDIAQDAVDGGYDWWTGLNIAMGLSANCSEDTKRITSREIARFTRNTFVGSFLVKEKLAVCRAWPNSWLPANHFAPFRSQVPTLLVSGKYDVVTSPYWGEVARKHFPNSRHIVVPLGHSLGRAGYNCVEQIAGAFFRDGRLDKLGTSCLGDLGPGPFPSEEAFPEPS